MICLQARGITKDFPGVRALDGVDFDLAKGEVHAIVGENGAGKSTFVKILAGIYGPTMGHLTLNGRSVTFSSPREAAKHIGVVHQERELVPFFSGTANLFLGQELGAAGFLRKKQMKIRAMEFVSQYGLDIDPAMPAQEMSIGKQEMLTILKILFRDPPILIFDEPTAALSMKESEILFALIRSLKAQGKSIIYISHHLPEVLDLADRVTILRNGRAVATVESKETDEAGIIRLMINKELGDQYPKKQIGIGSDRFVVSGFSSEGYGIKDVNFRISAGEIVGFAGLVGSGRTELAKAVFAGDGAGSGTITLDSKPFVPRSPRASVRRGLVLIPEDRRGEGVISTFEVGENMILPRLSQFSSGGFKSAKRIAERNAKIINDLAIKIFSPRQVVATLSGGNQQKVSLGKWFDSDASVWIFDEPTQGIDVETKSEIYGIMEQMAERGAGIWFISSDLRELMAIADRIYVMRDFGICAEFARPFSTQAILSAMLGKVES